MLQPGSSLKLVRQFLNQQIGRTYDKGETDAMTRILFNHFGLDHPGSYVDTDTIIDRDIASQINEIVNEIANNRPIQYILGYTFFYELKLEVDENVLIPRAETEEMVDLAIRNCTVNEPVILDIGTGSGCIAIAMKKNIPGARVQAIDKYEEALHVARENAALNAVYIDFFRGDILDPAFDPGGPCNLIISNPPYVTQAERSQMHQNVLDYEPGTALFVDDTDPLPFYRAISDLGSRLLARPGDIWVEINESFGKETQKIFLDTGYKDVKLMKDIRGKDRFIHVSVL